jgi:ribokinase
VIAVIGSSNMDIVFNVEHLTLPGETQKANSLNFYFGGKGANQAVTVAKLSNKTVYFCTCLGEDEYGNQISENYKKYDIQGYYIEKGEKTGSAFIEVEKTGENRIILFTGANDKVDKDKIDLFLNNYEEKIDICLLQNEIPPESVEYSILRLNKKGIKIVYDPAPVMSTNISVLGKVDFLTPNETEFTFLCDKLNIPENWVFEDKALAFKRLSKVSNLIIKLGEKGCFYIDNKENYGYIKALKVKAIDTTAAGDVFNGAFSVYYEKTQNFIDSLKFANAASAISVTRKGAQSSIPSYEEVPFKD